MEQIAWYIVFLFSATFHEAAHAFIALRLGDKTAYLGGQVTLDPIPHIKREPIGMVVLPIISVLLFGWPFGYASAPYDPSWAARNPHKASWMALAGPASNFALVLFSTALIWIGILLGYFEVPEEVNYALVVVPTTLGFASTFAQFLSIIFTLNLLMTVLNLIPMPPLDGSSVIGLFFNEEKAANIQHFMNNPSFGFIGLLLVWKVFNPIFHIAFLFIVSMIYPGVYS
jgi:Zn-dependent protease